MNRGSSSPPFFFRTLTIDASTDGGIIRLAGEVDERFSDQAGLVVVVTGDEDAPLAHLAGTTVTLLVDRPRAAPLVAMAVIERVVPGSSTRLVMDVRGPWEPLQRREAVRLDVAIRPRHVARITPDGEEPFDALIVNLSAQGVLLESGTRLTPGELLRLAFLLPATLPLFDTVVKTIRSQVRYAETRRLWQIGCHFVDLDEKASDAIFRFIFHEQRRRARWQANR